MAEGFKVEIVNGNLTYFFPEEVYWFKDSFPLGDEQNFLENRECYISDSYVQWMKKEFDCEPR